MTMKIKELCWAIAGTVMTFILGYIMFFSVYEEYASETEKAWFNVVCGLALCMMICLTGIWWSTALPEKDNDNEG